MIGVLTLNNKINTLKFGDSRAINFDSNQQIDDQIIIQRTKTKLCI
ncbi:unnamed protein product [Paramecium sonneborni]|uniref:Uncharacterized protein n=1 Tax=Paramecium sonneborni TaxID=65129 RepID=A0A8S1R5B9_9CILI|nr:unnamed protein product [Paramecium sonneborni]